MSIKKWDYRKEEYVELEEDPCEACMAMGGGSSYQCKRCRYGDDGDYSIWDVYSPSELL